MSLKPTDKSGLFETVIRKEINNEKGKNLLEVSRQVEVYPKEKTIVILSHCCLRQIIIPKNSPFTVSISENGQYLYINGETVARAFYHNTFNGNHLNRVRNFITTLLHYGEEDV